MRQGFAPILALLLTTLACGGGQGGPGTGGSPTPGTPTPPPPSGATYVTHKNPILPTLGSAPPAKGESRVDPVTGIRITRLTSATELAGTPDAFIVYSRFSPESSDGKFVLVHGANSTSSWVVDRTTGNVVAALASDDSGRSDRTIGENHEVRWDASGAHPNRVYFRNGMQLWMIDDVTRPSATRSLLRDFAAEVPGATMIYNDVEGDSSLDGDHWAFMAVHYNGSTYVVDAFLHYRISTNTLHKLVPADLAGSPLAGALAGRTTFLARPNMVEMAPDGSGVVIHYGRAYAGWNDAHIGTWFDGPHLWPVDFRWATSTPVKIAVDETHSGWAHGLDGRPLFISQNNRTDKLDAVFTAGTGAGYDARVAVAGHGDFGWNNGFHYGKVPVTRKGWAFLSTYDTSNSAWGSNQLLFIQIKPESASPKVWRIGSNYNRYAGDYRDEAPAALNLAGNRIYVSTNWGGMLDHREVFVFHLPDDWTSAAPLQ